MPRPEIAPSVVPRGARGATRVADRVVAKIASQAAREALSRSAESAPSVPPGRSKPHATVSARPAPEREHAFGQARVHIALELGYPSDIGAQCSAVRRVVSEPVSRLAGVKVQEVVVTVEQLHSAHTRGVVTGRTR
ncbi:Asp23/Gls24 family envelope stress response protein [Streptomyces sp. HUAS TT20]|nr:Asp23/Gls24 family envelope stress response protein [Streptomyces sp. HUAS 15-9]UXY32162.1 Asp23/Gls24 family envelope stress response protein [Streptomyces sp. HUAS 15-9]